MKLTYNKTDLHTHTCASGHGTKDRITDLAKEAANRHIEILGISDHGPASPGSAGLSYFRGLSLGERTRFGVTVRYGAEANILDTDGSLDIPDEILRTLDYCIISMHRPIYTSGSAAENTKAFLRAMCHPNVKIIGHCDDSRFPVDYRALTEGALSRGVVPELNNVSLLPGSYRRDCRENSIRLLQACEAISCPILLSSDSHGREHIGEVDAALALAEEVGFPRQLILLDYFV
ncbi:MAG: PHP domain-containing protein [Lachnospiraceae bacterium]|nr:PHP domain-containing protein [Lachnospiraceae bacterium]